MRTRVAGAALAAGILATACSGSLPVPIRSTPASPSPSPSSSAPSPVPPVALRSGNGTLKVSGQLKARLAVPIERSAQAVWQPSTGQIALQYLNRDGDALIIDGTVTGRTARTSKSFTLSFVLQEHNRPVAFS